MGVRPLPPDLAPLWTGDANSLEPFIQEVVRRSPERFAREILGVNLWSKQEEVLLAVRDYRRVAVKAGNGLGKGFTAAVAVLWFVSSYQPATVLTTAPTARQVRHVLWREIRRLYQGSAELMGGRMLHSRLEVAHDRFALGLSTDEVDQFQGFHSPNMLIVVDEAEGVTEPIYEAIDAVMTAGNSKLLLIGNPTSITGTFRRAFHEERHLYHNITISALESPNVRQQRVVVPGLTTHEWVAERLALWGESSSMYRARVLGDFSDRAEDTLISLARIEEAITRGANLRHSNHPVIPAQAGTHGPDSMASHAPYQWSDIQVSSNVPCDDDEPAAPSLSTWDRVAAAPSPSQGLSQHSPLPRRERVGVRGDLSHEAQDSDAPTILAVDVARFGTDQSVLLLASPDAVLHIEAHQGLDTMQLAGRVVDAHRRWSSERIVVDEIGVGAGVVDRLKELDLPVAGINVGRPARQRKLFANLRAEGYWRLYELFGQSELSIPNDAELAGQLSSLRYSYNSRGQLLIESKDDARSRGLPSPDKADAMMLAFLGHNPSVRLHT